MRLGSERKNSGRKKKWILPVSIIGGVLLLCLVVTGASLLKYYSGIYVRTSGGRHMVVFDEIGPVVLSTKDKPDRFDGIETGDRVVAICGFLDETYPAQSDAKFVRRLRKGDLEDIPQKYREELTELGWLDQNSEFREGAAEVIPDWGLTLSVKDVTPTGLTLVIKKNGGTPTGRIEWGEAYQLAVLEDGTWKDVPTIIDNAVWDAIAYGFFENSDVEISVSWEWLYGKLPVGTYRLEKEFMDYRGPGDYDTAMYRIEFKISE